jgi:RHS repeat-associated protein
MFDYFYDSNGNLTSKVAHDSGETTTLSYDHHGRLTSVILTDLHGAQLHTSTWRYDARGQRIATSENGHTSHFYFDGRNPFLVLRTNDGVVTRRMYARHIDQVLADELDGETRWILSDHVGTTRDLIANSGDTLAHYVYDSFGAVLSPIPSTSDHDVLFAGRVFSSATGLGNFRRRLYDPRAGRFYQEDVVAPWGYSYARNSPHMYIDPLGESLSLPVSYGWLFCNVIDVYGYAFGVALVFAPGAQAISAAFDHVEVDPHPIRVAALAGFDVANIALARVRFRTLIGAARAAAHTLPGLSGLAGFLDVEDDLRKLGFNVLKWEAGAPGCPF